MILDLPIEILDNVIAYVTPRSLDRHCLRLSCGFLSEHIPKEVVSLEIPLTYPIDSALELILPMKHQDCHLCNQLCDSYNSDTLMPQECLQKALLVQASRWGNLVNLQILLDKFNTSKCKKDDQTDAIMGEQTDDIVDAAVAYGSISHLEQVLALFPTHLLRHCLRAAIKYQHFDMIKWIAETENLPKIYGNGGQYLHFGLMHHNQVLKNALKTGNESIILYVAEMLRLTEFGCSEYFVAAAKSGQMKWVHWLLRRNCPKHKNTIRTAAVARNLDMVIELRQLNFPWNASTFSAACAVPNNEQVLQYLWDHRCPVDDWAYGAMMKPGTLTTAGEWLYAKNFSIHANTMIYACQDRDKKAIRWLVDHSCPVPHDIIRHALSFDDTAILDLIDEKYHPTLRQHYVYNDAVSMGKSIAVLDWLYAHHYPLDSSTWWRSRSCEKTSRHDYVKWLRAHKCPAAATDPDIPLAGTICVVGITLFIVWISVLEMISKF
jgi:hypothetical protein